MQVKQFLPSLTWDVAVDPQVFSFKTDLLLYEMFMFRQSSPMGLSNAYDKSVYFFCSVLRIVLL